MKIKILQEKLNEGLVNVERTTGKDTTLPILSNVLFRADKNFLNLFATNLETSVAWKILSKNEKEGSVVLPAQAFSGFIASLPNKPIDILLDGQLLTVVCEGVRSVFKGIITDEFPVLPINTDGESLIIRARELCGALSQVVGFTSPSTIKPEIAGVYFSLTKNLIKIVATDSFRLGEKTILLNTKETILKPRALILPQRAVREIVALFGSADGDVKIYFIPNQITIELLEEGVEQPKIQFVARLIEGEYPDYQAIIPSKFLARAEFSKKEFTNHIKSAGLFSGKTNEIGVRVEQKNTTLRVYSQSPELGEYEGDLKAIKIEGEDTLVAFNCKFLLDGLNAISGDRCVLELSGNDGPGVLKPQNTADFLYIVMPIKKN
jgi:DNA polymerase-3 subunit beta